MNKLDREELSPYRELAEHVGGILAMRWMKSRKNIGSEPSQITTENGTKLKKRSNRRRIESPGT